MGEPAARTREFDKSKIQLLQGLESGVDKSKKGSLDAPIVDLVGLINDHVDYVTTSSCSGRITLFEDIDGTVCRKSGGKWLLSSHEPIDVKAAQQSLETCQALSQKGGSVTLKQEPLVMHIECRDILAAERLLKIGVASGFRESGISLGKKRTLVAIRTGANSLEAPVILGGERLMTESGLAALVKLANHKFALNAERTMRLMQALKEDFGKPMAPVSESAGSKRKAKKEMPPSSKKGEAVGCGWGWIEARGSPERETMMLLQRWGHSVCKCIGGAEKSSNTAWVFGGYGWSGSGKPLARLNSTVEVKLQDDGSLSVMELHMSESDIPEAREKHAAAMIQGLGKGGSLMVMFGGRASPTKPFDDLWTLSEDRGWNLIKNASGQAPSPRWSHSLTATQNAVVVYGGRDNATVFGGSFHILHHEEAGVWRWSEVRTQGPGSLLPPLFSHTCVASHESHLVIFGGLKDLTSRKTNPDAIIVSLSHGKHSSISLSDQESGGRFGHTALPLPHVDVSNTTRSSIIITGGVSSNDDAKPIGCSRILKLDLDHVECKEETDGLKAKMMTASLPKDMLEPPMIHHGSVILTPSSAASAGEATPVIVCIGGGAQTFAFSPVFSPPMILSMSNGRRKDAGHPRDGKKTKEKKTSAASLSKPSGGRAINSYVNGGNDPCPCLLVPPHATKLVKTALERGDVIDRTHRITASKAHPSLMAIPVASDAAEEVRQWIPSAPERPPTATPSRGIAIALDALKGCMDVIQGWSDEVGLAASASTINSQLLRFKALLEEVIQKAGLSPSLLTPALSTHIERLGDAILIEDVGFRGPWEQAYDLLLPALLHMYRASRIARLAPVQAGTKRRSQIKIIYPPASSDASTAAEGPGSPGWVTVKENGLTYSFDMTKVMFSSGNISEKARIAQMNCRGEVVVDLYAGIGYFTLPMLVHGGAKKLIACEWNPDSIIALRCNLEANGVEKERVEILAGDNRLTTQDMRGIADRVHLGLIPSSEEGWPIAVRLLKPAGGMLHVHGNMLEESIDFWVQRVIREIRQLGQKLEQPWAEREVQCLHVEKVKSYAPSVWHVVADVRCE